MRLGVIDLAGRAQEAGFGRRSVDDEPRVDRDAMSTDPRTRLEDLHARMTICEADEFPDVDAELIADERELIGEGDIHVAEGVLGQLGELGRASVGQEDLRGAEGGVEIAGLFGGGWSQSTTDAVIGDELFEHLAREDALGAVRVE